MLTCPRLVGHAAALLQIAAGAEGLVAGAGQNDAAQALGIERDVLEIAHEIAPHLGVERVGSVGPVQPDDRDVFVDPLDGERLEIGVSDALIVASQEKPLSARRILPMDGEGKCAVQHSVSVSQ